MDAIHTARYASKTGADVAALYGNAPRRRDDASHAPRNRGSRKAHRALWSFWETIAALRSRFGQLYATRQRQLRPIQMLMDEFRTVRFFVSTFFFVTKHLLFLIASSDPGYVIGREGMLVQKK